MTGHLARLAARATGQEAGLRPRARSLFEQPTNPASVGEYVAPGVPTSPGPDVAGSGPDLAEHLPGGRPGGSRAPDRPESVPGVAGPRGSAPPPPRGRQAETATPDRAEMRPPSRGTPLPQGPWPTPEPAPDEVPATGRPAAALRHVEQPGAPPPRGRTPIETDASRPRPGVRPPPSITRHPRLVDPPADGQSQEAGEAALLSRIDAPQPSTGPVAREEGTAPRPPVPVASQPATLPRLQPAPGTDRGQPGVTVNIGRIEVLPPRATESKRPPRTVPGRRTTGAPDLADYLRDRGRR